jgi:hypothetical protein
MTGGRIHFLQPLIFFPHHHDEGVTPTATEAPNLEMVTFKLWQPPPIKNLASKTLKEPNELDLYSLGG